MVERVRHSVRAATAMRHPSKVGAFCSRKIARGASDKVLGGGSGPLRCGKHLRRGPRMPTGERVPFWKKLRANRLRVARRRAAHLARKAAKTSSDRGDQG